MSDDTQEVKITDARIPWGSMIRLVVQVAIISIPIGLIIGFFVAVVLTALSIA